MAAVLVLGLLYTVLAGAAMRGLRSEGIDRRRADAEMIADREITTIETELASRRSARGRPARARGGAVQGELERRAVRRAVAATRSAARGDRARHRSQGALACSTTSAGRAACAGSRCWWSGTRRARRTRRAHHVRVRHLRARGSTSRPTEATATRKRPESELEKVRRRPRRSSRALMPAPGPSRSRSGERADRDEREGRAPRRPGFTLFEVLGVVLVTALLLGAAISFFLNLTRQARARPRTRARCGAPRRCSIGSPRTSSTHCS